MKEYPIEPEINNNDDMYNDIFQRKHSKTVTKKNNVEFLKFRSSKVNRKDNTKIPQIKQDQFRKNSSFHDKKNIFEIRTALYKKKRLSLIGDHSDKKKKNYNNLLHANNDILKGESLSLFSLKKLSESNFDEAFDEDLFSEKTESFNKNNESLIQKNIDLNNSNKHQINKIKTRKIKSDYLLTISILYYSIFLLLAKIITSIKLPEIPPTSIILFLIYFHEIIFSVVFMSIDHIDVTNNFDTKDLYHYLIHIFLEYIKLFLIIKGLRHLRLLSFILIIYLNPLLTSLIILKQKMEEIKRMDRIFIILAIFVIFYQFLFFDKLGAIYSTFLLIMISFTNTRDYKTAINFHVYFLIFGTAIIGVAISSLIMGIQEGNLNISNSQYLCILVLCFAHFFHLYFTVKYIKRKSENVRRKIINAILPIVLVFSYFIFGDKYNYSMYFTVCLSLSAHIYGKIKLEAMDND